MVAYPRVPKSLPSRTGPGGMSFTKFGPTKNYGYPDLCTDWFWYLNDFESFNGAANSKDWITTITGTGAQTLQNEQNGILKIVNSAAQNDQLNNQWAGGPASVTEFTLLDPTKRHFFKTRFRTDDTTNAEIFFGIYKTSTAPVANGGAVSVTDGILLVKARGATTWVLTTAKGGVQVATGAITVPTLTNGASFTNNVYMTMGWSYEPRNNQLTANFNDIGGGNQPSIVAGASFPNTQTLAVGWGLINGTAVARSLSADYIFFAQER